MAITIVQNLNTFALASAGVLLATSATTPGSTVIGIIGVNDLNANVTGPAGWVKDSATDNIGATGCCQVYSGLTPGGETAFQWLGSAGKNYYVQFFEVAGLSVVAGATSIRDRQSAQAPASAASIALLCALANRLPDEFAVAGASMITTGGAFVSMSGGWTNDTGATGVNGDGKLYAGHKIISAAETSADTITWTTSRVTAGCIATYRGPSLDYAGDFIT